MFLPNFQSRGLNNHLDAMFTFMDSKLLSGVQCIRSIDEKRVEYKRKDRRMRTICVYAGSNRGTRPEYEQAARILGRELVARGLGLVYGGGSVGLMGALAEAVTTAGGEVIGVLPSALFPREVAYAHGTKLYE